MRVYPRAGGGTGALPRRPLRGPGLSPRRRGNQANGINLVPESGSIPAQAGEPTRPGIRRSGTRVYPRAGGGTVTSSRRPRTSRGLSPRRRGNPGRDGRPPARRWSIPAQAGEPLSLGASSSADRVYPRAGGGTTREQTLRDEVKGLSPRRRGNLHGDGNDERNKGSIPAQAGEPAQSVPRRVTGRVYPRAGGGTKFSTVRHVIVQGLSPRRRGNRALRLGRGASLGSIPAQAGEPDRRSLGEQSARVYPRAGGGTITT